MIGYVTINVTLFLTNYILGVNFMKRILSLFAAFAVMLSLSACRANDTGQTLPLSETVVSETASKVEIETQTTETNIETVIIDDQEIDINTEEIILYGADLTNDNLEKLTKYRGLKK